MVNRSRCGRRATCTIVQFVRSPARGGSPSPPTRRTVNQSLSSKRARVRGNASAAGGVGAEHRSLIYAERQRLRVRRVEPLSNRMPSACCPSFLSPLAPFSHRHRRPERRRFHVSTPVLRDPPVRTKPTLSPEDARIPQRTHRQPRWPNTNSKYACLVSVLFFFSSRRQRTV